MEPKYLTAKDAALRTGLSVKTLNDWRWQGKGPKYYKVGTKAVRYATADLDSFMADFEVVTIDQPRPTKRP
ncbi:MAG: helix-turn-helix transcriptional regulator [Enterobacterales bacterium]